MRITKKFAGDTSVGKKVFHPCFQGHDTALKMSQAAGEVAEYEQVFNGRLARRICSTTRNMDLMSGTRGTHGDVSEFAQANVALQNIFAPSITTPATYPVGPDTSSEVPLLNAKTIHGRGIPDYRMIPTTFGSDSDIGPSEFVRQPDIPSDFQSLRTDSGSWTQACAAAHPIQNPSSQDFEPVNFPTKSNYRKRSHPSQLDGVDLGADLLMNFVQGAAAGALANVTQNKDEQPLPKQRVSNKKSHHELVTSTPNKRIAKLSSVHDPSALSDTRDVSDVPSSVVG